MSKTIENFPYNSNNPNASRSPSWDGSQERMFIENILNQRFNFLLVFVGLVVSGAINARDNKLLQLAVLLFGTVVSFLLSWAIFRAHQKLDVILKTLYSDTTHPAAMVNKAVCGCSARWIIGWGIPFLCSAFLLIGAIVLIVCAFSTANQQQVTTQSPPMAVPTTQEVESIGEVDVKAVQSE